MLKRASISILPLAALAIALFVTGCGSSDSTADEPATITKAAFIKQGDALCQKSYAQRSKTYAVFSRKHRGEITAYKIVTIIVLPSIQKVVKELEALGVPEGDEKQVKEMLAEIENGVVGAKKVAKKDPENFEVAFTKAAALATRYGLKGCAEIL